MNVWVIYGVGGPSPTTAFDWAKQNVPQTRMKKCPIGCHNTVEPTSKAHSKYLLFDRPYLGWQQPHSGIVYSAQAASVAHISPDDERGAAA